MCMMLNDDIIKLLAQTKVNKCLQFGYNNIRVKPIPEDEPNPCGKCVFNRRNGCIEDIDRIKHACMGRFRDDGNSVVFIKDNK